MAPPLQDWVPFQWPAAWTDPGLLRFVEGTPVNCLLLEEAQAEVREAAQARGFVCPPPVRWQAWRELNWASPGPLAAIGDGFWPELSQKGGDSEQAGPTGAPWLDANGWLIAMARARLPEETALWIRSGPPEDPRAVRWTHYQLALLEAWAYGACRPLWLFPPHAEALRAGGEEARRGWAALTGALEWMEARRAWRRCRTFARLAIASDFTGANEYIGSETLLLAARQGIPFTPLERSRVNRAALEGIRALVWCDPAPVPAEILDWVRQGGRLMAMPGALKSWKRPAATAPQEHARFLLHADGQGVVAEARAAFDDPWLLARDSRLIASKQWDAVRLFNEGSLQWRHAHAPERHVVHLLNYTLRPSWNPVSVQTSLPVRRAVFHAPGRAPAPLELRRELGGLEAAVPAFAVYGAVEFESADG